MDLSAKPFGTQTVPYLGRHELGRTTERARSGAKPHVLFAQTVVSYLDMPIERQQDIVEL